MLGSVIAIRLNTSTYITSGTIKEPYLGMLATTITLIIQSNDYIMAMCIDHFMKTPGRNAIAKTQKLTASSM